MRTQIKLPSIPENLLKTSQLFNFFTTRIATNDEKNSLKILRQINWILLIVAIVIGISFWLIKTQNQQMGIISIGIAINIYWVNLLLLQHVRSVRLGTIILIASAIIPIWLHILTDNGYSVLALLWIVFPAWLAIIIIGYRTGLFISACTLVLFLLYHTNASAIFFQLDSSSTQYIAVSTDGFAFFFSIFLICSSLILALLDYSRNYHEQQLIATEQKHRLFIEQTDMAVIDCDTDGTITGWNAGAAKIFGYSGEEAMRQNLILLLTLPETQRQVLRTIACLQERTEATEIRTVNRNRTKEGKIITCSWSNTGIWTDNGSFLGFVCSAVDITQQIEKEHELQQAKEAAEAATHAKSAFLANMSHEIRTPMNGIIGMSNLLLATKLDTSQQDYVENVDQSANALLGIINEVLDFSKIESGKLLLISEQFDLHRCLSDIFRLFETRTNRATVTMLLNVHKRVPRFIKSDPGRLRQILVNLIGNAVKFTTEGEIELTVDARHIDPQMVELSFFVRDTGIGIPADKIDQLFENFRQVDVLTTRQYGGTGLGLSIAKLLVEKMDGVIWVESTPMQGSTFYVTLPVQSVFFDEPPTAPIHRNVMVSAQSIITAAETTKQLAILVVEDNPVNQKVALRTFDYLGYSVDLVHNGFEAVAAVQKQPYDVIFMDIQMPEMDGLEATRQIRQLPNQPPLQQIVAMTAAVLKDEQQRAMDAGMDDLITKPIHPEKLAQKLVDLQATPVPSTAVSA